MRKIILAILMLIFFLLALLQNLRPCPGLTGPESSPLVKEQVLTPQGEYLAKQSKNIYKPAADGWATIFGGK